MLVHGFAHLWRPKDKVGHHFWGGLNENGSHRIDYSKGLFERIRRCVLRCGLVGGGWEKIRAIPMCLSASCLYIKM